MSFQGSWVAPLGQGSCGPDGLTLGYHGVAPSHSWFAASLSLMVASGVRPVPPTLTGACFSHRKTQPCPLLAPRVFLKINSPVTLTHSGHPPLGSAGGVCVWGVLRFGGAQAKPQKGDAWAKLDAELLPPSFAPHKPLP